MPLDLKKEKKKKEKPFPFLPEGMENILFVVDVVLGCTIIQLGRPQ